MTLQIRSGFFILLVLGILSSYFVNTTHAQQASDCNIPVPVTQGGDYCDVTKNDGEACKPLMDMQPGDAYGSFQGGLYDNYQNSPPPDHAAKIESALNAITPMDINNTPGDPTDDKIVLLTLGMSNTNGKSFVFKQLAQANPNVSDNIIIVNGARSSITADKWANGVNWAYVDNELQKAGVDSSHVQVIWMEHANFAPGNEAPPGCTSCLLLGDPDAENKYANKLAKDMRRLIAGDPAVASPGIKGNYPNVRLIFMSNRSYGGYALSSLNDEPYAYESSFSVRSVILDQINPPQNPDYDVSWQQDSNGNYKYVLLWGPYLWARGTTPNSEGLLWNWNDFYYVTTNGVDCTHPFPSDPTNNGYTPGVGYGKAGEYILNFFLTSSYSNSWFAKGALPTPSTTPQPTPVPTGSSVPGDANADGKVDGLDYVIWLINYNQTTSNGASVGDFNNDGNVDGLDYVIWLVNYTG